IDIIKKILAESINCVVTSPPYYGLRNYGLPPTDWPEVSYAPMPGLPPLIIPPTTCCLGLEDSIEAYVGHIVLVFRGLWKVLRNDGTLWLNLGDSYATGTKASRPQFSPNGTVGANRPEAQNSVPRVGTPTGLKTKDLIGIPWRVAFALQADGWYLRNDIIWHKPSAMPESVTDRCTKAHEYIFLLTKKPKYWYDQEAIREANSEGTPLQGRNKRTVWTVAGKPYKGAHFATFPPDLIEPCILAGCPSRVCVECDEPWVRVVERRKADVTRPRPLGKKGNDDHNDTLRIYEEHTSVTIGFTPTCQCAPLPGRKEATRPGVVLDPFFGAGTVGVAARQLKRDWLGVDLNADYIEMARERLDQTQPPLFSEVILYETRRKGKASNNSYARRRTADGVEPSPCS
ncbi:hypothetical protein LCGC14_2767010, partial [marine sediment metagenome]